jgi:hypothetical protein
MSHTGIAWDAPAIAPTDEDESPRERAKREKFERYVQSQRRLLVLVKTKCAAADAITEEQITAALVATGDIGGWWRAEADEWDDARRPE